MKACLIALIALGLSACASTSDKSSMAVQSVADSNRTEQPIPSYYSDVDWEYVKKVERIAARRGVMVKWVQMPRKKGLDTSAKN